MLKLLIVISLSLFAITIFSTPVYAQETATSNATTSEYSNADLLAYAILHLKQAIIQLQNGNSTGLEQELNIVTEQASAVLIK